jgi:hypothetical protein
LEEKLAVVCFETTSGVIAAMALHNQHGLTVFPDAVDKDELRSTLQKALDKVTSTQRLEIHH